jgi:hypothetical protein
MVSPIPTYPLQISTHAAPCRAASQRIRHTLPKQLRPTCSSQRTLRPSASRSALLAGFQNGSNAARSSRTTALGTETAGLAIKSFSHHLEVTADLRAGMRNSSRDSFPTQAALMHGVGQ